MENLSYTFVTSLDEAPKALTSDVFLISQLSNTAASYLSKKLPYSKLCSLILVDVDSKIDERLDDVISELSSKVDVSIEGIQFISSKVDDCITAIVKIANCVQVNKSNIQYISSEISSMSKGNILSNIYVENGLSSKTSTTTNGQIKLNIGHSYVRSSGASVGLYKIGYDKFGHVNSSSNVTKNDITSLGIPGSYPPVATTAVCGLIKLSPRDFTQTDRYRLSLDVDANAYVDVPLKQELANAIVPADQDRLGVVALCSNIRAALKDDEQFKNKLSNIYPLQMIDSKYAYVEVSAANSGGTTTIDDGYVKASNCENTISSVTTQNGKVTGVGESHYIYSKVEEVSGNALLTSNTKLQVDVSNSTLNLYRDGYLVTRVNLADLMLESSMQTSVEFVRSYETIDSDTDTSVKHNNPAIKTTTNVNGLQEISYSDLPYEDWTFTLDNGSTTTKRVVCY